MDKMEDLKKELDKYGKIIDCYALGDRVNFLITTGFDIRATNTLELIKLLSDRFPEYPIIEHLKTDNNFFRLTLKKKRNKL